MTTSVVELDLNRLVDMVEHHVFRADDVGDLLLIPDDQLAKTASIPPGRFCQPPTIPEQSAQPIAWRDFARSANAARTGTHIGLIVP
jgi:hypothetical protein